MPPTSVPDRRIVPASGYSKPAINLNVVVFPHPDGPSKESNSPAATSKETPSTARTSPNDLETSWSIRSGVRVGSRKLVELSVVDGAGTRDYDHSVEEVGWLPAGLDGAMRDE